jgi:hypothetical protein
VPGAEAYGSAALHQDAPAAALNGVSIDDLQEGMASGRYTGRSITGQYLARIEAIDKAGPMLLHPADAGQCSSRISGSIRQANQKSKRNIAFALVTRAALFYIMQ